MISILCPWHWVLHKYGLLHSPQRIIIVEPLEHHGSESVSSTDEDKPLWGDDIGYNNLISRQFFDVERSYGKFARYAIRQEGLKARKTELKQPRIVHPRTGLHNLKRALFDDAFSLQGHPVAQDFQHPGTDWQILPNAFDGRNIRTIKCFLLEKNNPRHPLQPRNS